MSTGRILFLLPFCALAGCLGSIRRSAVPPAAKVVAGETRVEQKGEAQTPATAKTETVKRELVLPAGSFVAVNRAGELEYRLAKDTPIKAEVKVEQVTAPAAFTPPKPPTVAEEAEAKADFCTTLGYRVRMVALIRWALSSKAPLRVRASPLANTLFTAMDEFRINFGTSDDLTRIFPYGQSVLVCFKTDSISYLRNVYADLAEVAAAEVTREVGLVAPNAVAQLGSAVWFLGRGGLYKFVPGDQDKVELESATLSAPMQPFFNELNWREIGAASMAVDEERIYIAAPYGLTETTINALAVYNHVTSQWEGYHTFPSGADCLALIETFYLGKRRVWWVDRTGKFLILNEDLGSDYYNSAHVDIEDELLTRGYCASNEPKKFNRLTVGLKTWGATVTINAVAAGPGEEQTIADEMTADRTKYVINLPDYDITNINDDFAEPYREDYQILAGDGAEPLAGVYANLHAEKLYRARLNKRSTYLQLRITNTTGSCTVTSAAVEGVESSRATISYA